MRERRFFCMIGQPGNFSYYSYLGSTICRTLRNNFRIRSFHVQTPHAQRIKKEFDHETVRDVALEQKPTDVIAVNIPARLMTCLHDLPFEVDFHYLVQDLYEMEATADDDKELEEKIQAGKTSVREHRWMWCKPWVERYGGKWLPPTTDHWRYYRQPSDMHDCDLSFVGFIPLQTFMIHGDPQVQLTATAITHAALKILRQDGTEADLRSDLFVAEALIKRAEAATGFDVPPPALGVVVYTIRHTLMRYVQRYRLMTEVVRLSKKNGWSLRIAGQNWDFFTEFRPYFIGQVDPALGIAHLAQSATISLHANGDTNYHNRVLDVWASGGFCLSEKLAPDDGSDLPEPDFTMDTLEARIQEWLGDASKRNELIDEARVKCAKNHSYETRLGQLLSGTGA